MTRSWDDLKEDFKGAVFKRGVANVADAIPADVVTVYRLINGTTEKPSRAVQAGVERVVEETKRANE